MQNGTAAIVWNQRLLILQGVAVGLNFLHTKGEKPLIHRDIKSANVLLDNKLSPKVRLSFFSDKTKTPQ